GRLPPSLWSGSGGERQRYANGASDGDGLDYDGAGVHASDPGARRDTEDQNCFDGGLEQEKKNAQSGVGSRQNMSKLTGSSKATQFTESVIREMTRLNDLHGGVNLSQGFPDFPAPADVKAAAIAAIEDDVNQYAVTWGARPLREAVAREFTRRYGLDVVADEQ